MTVGELIEKLSVHPRDAVVLMYSRKKSGRLRTPESIAAELVYDEGFKELFLYEAEF